MPTEHPTAATPAKWQHMLALVTKQQPFSPQTLSQQFRRLSLIRFLGMNFIIFALQYTGLIISTFSASTFPLWFASGGACGLVFVWGERVLPGIWLGSVFAYLLQKAGLPLALAGASIFTLQAWVLLRLSYRYITPTLIFYSRLVYVKFILAAAILTAITTFLLVYLTFPVLYQPQAPIALWLQWWLANLGGLLIFAFMFTTFDSYFPQLPNLAKMNLLALGVYFAILITLAITLLFSTQLTFIMGLLVALFVVHFAISYRYGWAGMATAVFIAGLLLSFGVYLEAPLYNNSLGLIVFIYIKLFLLAAVVFGGLVSIGHNN